ncbi:VOC family protein [Amycolatopsis sp. NPDC048633]|uniref:VOC family protein n=1 Tax=Amycolatopsis sp. NPDC048633 TaxID=3157095 RepID=UPI0033DEE8B6
MSTPGVTISQVAIVVHDLEATMAAYHRIFGWGPWQVIDYTKLPHHGTTVRGTPTDYTMRTAVADVGGIQFEIVEPGPGASQYREFLDSKGEGLHHILLETPDGQAATMNELLRAQGIPVLMGGAIGNLLDYAYHDAADELKVTIETTDVHPGGDVGILTHAMSEYPPSHGVDPEE